MNIIEVTEKLSVSAQPQLKHVASLKVQGSTTVINSRPDGEEPAQPPSAAEEDAAWAAGLAYLHIPVIGASTQAEYLHKHRSIFESFDADRGRLDFPAGIRQSAAGCSRTVSARPSAVREIENPRP